MTMVTRMTDDYGDWDDQDDLIVTVDGVSGLLWGCRDEKSLEGRGGR